MTSFELQLNVRPGLQAHHRQRDLARMGLQLWPARIRQNHNGDPATREILLITQPSVGRNQHIELLLGAVEQLSVRELPPSRFKGSDHVTIG
jgi:hypothetical protein